MKSVTSIKQTELKEKWYLVDASDKRIGLIASKVAEILIGKNNPLTKTYHKPVQHVIIINSDKIDVTPKRALTKFYKRYSGFPDGLKFESLEKTKIDHPERPLEIAIKGMLPKTKRGDLMFANLEVLVGEVHTHQAQQPELINLNNFKI